MSSEDSTTPVIASATSTTNSMAPSTESSLANEIPNPKFKTALCKNFLSSSCSRQIGCHFAHGSEELRAVSENSGFFEEVEKPTNDFFSKWPNNIPTNYKTTLCKFYEQVGTCKYDQNCNFAHGDQEKRNIPETIQTQLKGSRNSSKHVNNSQGQKNTMQQQQMNSLWVQQNQFDNYMMYVLMVQYAMIEEFCKRIEVANGAAKEGSDFEYVKKTVNDIRNLAGKQKLNQAFSQLEKLLSRKDASPAQKVILVDLQAYLSKVEPAAVAAAAANKNASNSNSYQAKNNQSNAGKQSSSGAPANQKKSSD